MSRALSGHGMVIHRTVVKGRSTSWLAGCTCGWQHVERRGIRWGAKGDFEVHKAQERLRRAGLAR